MPTSTVELWFCDFNESEWWYESQLCLTHYSQVPSRTVLVVSSPWNSPSDTDSNEFMELVPLQKVEIAACSTVLYSFYTKALDPNRSYSKYILGIILISWALFVFWFGNVIHSESEKSSHKVIFLVIYEWIKIQNWIPKHTHACSVHVVVESSVTKHSAFQYIPIIDIIPCLGRYCICPLSVLT